MWLIVCNARLFTNALAQTGPKKVSVIQSRGKTMEVCSGHSELSVISQVSAVEAVEGSPLSRVPLVL